MRLRHLAPGLTLLGIAHLFLGCAWSTSQRLRLISIDIRANSLIQLSPDHQTRFTDVRELHAGFNKWCWIDTPNIRRRLDYGYAVTWRPCKVSSYQSDSGKPMSTMSGGGVSWTFWEGTLGDQELKNVRIAEYKDNEKYTNYGSGALSGAFKQLHRKNLFCYDLKSGRICVADFE